MPDRPRALLVDLSVRFGGATARAVALARGMPEGQVALACLVGAPAHEEAAALGIDVRPVARSKADPRIAARLARLARTGGFRVFDSQNVQSQVWCRLAARKADVALVSTLNSWYESEYLGSLRGRLYQAAQRWTDGATDFHIAVSADIREWLLRSGAPPDRLALIPNAVTLDPAAVAGDAAWLASVLGLPAGARVVCAVGRLVEAKALDVLIEAVATLADSTVHAVIVGDGHLRPSLEALARRLELRPRVHFLGAVPHARTLSIVKSADVFAMPSRTEGTPVALLEAAALARPIVATAVGGIPEVVVHGEHALLVAPGDARALADSLREVLRDPAGAATMGATAARWVASRHGVAAQVEATLSAHAAAWEARRMRRAPVP